MSIECTCCDTFECQKAEYVRELFERIPFLTDPLWLRGWQRSIHHALQREPYAASTYNALYYSMELALGISYPCVDTSSEF